MPPELSEGFYEIVNIPNVDMSNSEVEAILKDYHDIEMRKMVEDGYDTE